LAAVWDSYPYGIAAIGADGNVRAINPAFETCTGLAGAALLGISEADFDALLGALSLERSRVETTGGGLRAVHYLRNVEQCCASEPRSLGLSEALREPLASIYGFTELLLMQEYDEETRRSLVATVLEQAEAMANIINARLDIRPYQSAPVAARRASIDHK
jgi:hypothetical protein